MACNYFVNFSLKITNSEELYIYRFTDFHLQNLLKDIVTFKMIIRKIIKAIDYSVYET